MDRCQTLSGPVLLRVPRASTFQGWEVRRECRELMVNLWLMVRQPWYETRWCKVPLPLDASTTLSPVVTTKNVRTLPVKRALGPCAAPRLAGGSGRGMGGIRSFCLLEPGCGHLCDPGRNAAARPLSAP